jgi:hypothetical protein
LGRVVGVIAPTCCSVCSRPCPEDLSATFEIR